MLRKIVRAIPPARNAGRAIREFFRHDEFAMALYRKVFERGRLTLPKIPPEALVADHTSVELPAFHPLFAGEDAPVVDLLFLLALAKSRRPSRILEVGTFRARSTFALHRNCPEAHIVSYDIQVLPSPYRSALKTNPQVELRNASFGASAESLLREKRFDFIFVDGAHDVSAVLSDSQLALRILDPQGIIIWHDYRYNGYRTDQLRVPEALRQVQEGREFFHVQETTCAIYCPGFTWNH